MVRYQRAVTRQADPCPVEQQPLSFAGPPLVCGYQLDELRHVRTQRRATEVTYLSAHAKRPFIAAQQRTTSTLLP